MTFPEESRRKSKKTDETVLRPKRARKEQEQGGGRQDKFSESTTMAEALDEANITPEDFEGESR